MNKKKLFLKWIHEIIIEIIWDPIRHIDISSDDKYIIITYDKYLMLLKKT